MLKISNTPINLQTNHDALQDEKHGSLNTAQILSKNQSKSSSRGVNSQMCHQCQRKDMGKVVNCTMCHKRRFCIKCITKWYPLLSIEEAAEKCPPCRGYCNCKHCLRNKIYMPPKRVMHSTNEVNHAWHVVQNLFPWLTEFHERQNAEKLMEAEVKGFNACDLLIPKAKCKSERICCYKCNSYIVDFHWSCCNCTCIICLSCCQELLNPDVLITSETLLYVGSDQWDPLSDKEICEIPVLKLSSVLGESFISKLYEDVNEIVTNDLQFDEPEGDISKCSCLIKSIGKGDLVCPMVAEVKEGDFSHFQLHWVKGEPVIVRDVLEMSSGLSWDPMVMQRALRETKYKEHGPNLLAFAVDCRGWSDVEINMQHFFTGYQAGLCHRNGWPQLLRMKHHHSDSSFAERSPRHEQEFLEIVPFPEYTDPRNGPLNLLSYLPLDKPIPQLGPMIDIAYGFHEELGDGDSVIRLHYAMNDVVNILMHTVEAYDAVMRHNVLYKLKKDEGQKMKISNDYGGALWDIWRREDVPKLRDYLTKNVKNFANHDSLSSCLADDLICYESVYLTMQHKRKLKDEYGIEPWTFEQNLGDAVLVPAGCPYQVRNLKSCINVTLGFISTESFQVCLGLADACRLQSRTKEDKLEVKKMAIYALEKATSCLRSGMLKVRGNEQKVDEQTEKNQGFSGNQLILLPPLVMTDLNYPPAESEDLGQPAEYIWQGGSSHAKEQAFECDRPMDQESVPNSEDVGDSPQANQKKFRKTLTDLQRVQIYSALLEISSHGRLKRDSTERVAKAFNVNRHVVQRIWKKVKECRDQGVPVNVTSRRPGNCGRKKIDLDLSRVSSIPLNKRSTIRSLAEALGVKKSTLHKRFKEGLLQRHSSHQGSGPGHANNFDTRVLTNSEFLELDGNAVSHSFQKSIPDTKQETAYLPCPELHEFNGNQGSGPGRANNFDTRVLTNSEFLELDGDSVPQTEPDNNNVTMDSSELVFHDFQYYVPEPEFHNFYGQPAEYIWQEGSSHVEEQAFECDRPMDQESAPNSEDVGDSPQANQKKIRKTLTDLQRVQIYSALLEISSHGRLKRDSTERVAKAFNVNRHVVQRIWRRVKECRNQGVPVNVTSRKPGNCGRKKIDLDLSRVSSIPLNKRSTIRSLAEALGVKKSTLHKRFKEGLLQRHSSNQGSGPGHANDFDTRVLTNSEFLELDGNAVSHSVQKVKPDTEQETAYLPCPELHEFNGNQGSGPGHANNFDTRVLTNSEFLELDGDSVPQTEPDNNNCKEEMLRFRCQIPSYPLTNDNAAVKGKKLTGCVELDPAAPPLEFLEVAASKTT